MPIGPLWVRLPGPCPSGPRSVNHSHGPIQQLVSGPPHRLVSKNSNNQSLVCVGMNLRSRLQPIPVTMLHALSPPDSVRRCSTTRVGAKGRGAERWSDPTGRPRGERHEEVPPQNLSKKGSEMEGRRSEMEGYHENVQCNLLLNLHTRVQERLS